VLVVANPPHNDVDSFVARRPTKPTQANPTQANATEEAKPNQVTQRNAKYATGATRRDTTRHDMMSKPRLDDSTRGDERTESMPQANREIA